MSGIFKNGDIVDCMYGRCKVNQQKSDSNNTKMYQCTPLHWTLAQKCIPVFNLNEESMKLVTLSVGTDIRCPYGGKGTIKEIRAVGSIKHFIVTLKNWQLAQGQSPTLYLDPQSVVY